MISTLDSYHKEVNKYLKYLLKLFNKDLKFLNLIALLIYFDKNVFIKILNRVYECVLVSKKKINTKRMFITLLEEYINENNINLNVTNDKLINELNFIERVVLVYKLYLNKTPSYYKTSKLINISKDEFIKARNKINNIGMINEDIPNIDINLNDLDINYNLLCKTNYLRISLISICTILGLVIIFFLSALICSQVLMYLPSDNRAPNEFYDGDYYEVKVDTIIESYKDIFDEKVTMTINKYGFGYVVNNEYDENLAFYFEGLNYDRFTLNPYTLIDGSFNDFSGTALIDNNEYTYYSKCRTYRDNLKLIFIDETLDKTILVMHFTYIDNLNW